MIEEIFKNESLFYTIAFMIPVLPEDVKRKSYQFFSSPGRHVNFAHSRGF